MLSISLIVIVILMTIKWSGIENLADKISFALTVTSLFLSLIAIVFAIISNSSFSSSTVSLQDTSGKITDVTNKLVEVTSEIEESVNQLPTLFDGLGKKVTDSHKELLEKLAEKQEVAMLHSGSARQTESMENFLSISSYNGLMILYASSLALAKKISFKLERLDVNREYAKGFLVAACAANVIEFTENDDSIVVSYLREDIASEVQAEIKRRSEALWEKDPDTLKSERESLKKLEDYLSP